MNDFLDAGIHFRSRFSGKVSSSTATRFFINYSYKNAAHPLQRDRERRSRDARKRRPDL